MADLLQRKVLEMEERLAGNSTHLGERVAVFDLDGTLLEGDIGEAVFAHLILRGSRVLLSWQEYQRQLHTHRSKAYRSVVQAMAGLDTWTVLDATKEVMSGKSASFTIQSSTLQRPKPHPSLLDLVSFLQARMYSIYVVSASNHISVQYVASHWFGIPLSHAFGLQVRLQNEILSTDLVEPVPLGIGKVHLLQSISPSIAPLITATDSRIDIPLLKLTHPQGFSIWVGDDRIDFGVVLEESKPAHEFCFVEASQRAPLNEY